MKRILIITVGLFLLTLTCVAQTTKIGGKKSIVEVLGALKVDSAAILPTGYSGSFQFADSAGRMWYDVATKSMWYHDGTERHRISSTSFVDSSVLSSGGQHQYVFKVASVNCNAIGNNPLGATGAVFGRFIVTTVVVVPKTVSGTVTTAPVLSIGFTPTGYTDIFPNTALTTTPTANLRSAFLAANIATIPASTNIVARISTAAAYSGGGVYIVDVYVQGYYEFL